MRPWLRISKSDTHGLVAQFAKSKILQVSVLTDLARYILHELTALIAAAHEFRQGHFGSVALCYQLSQHHRVLYGHRRPLGNVRTGGVSGVTD